jgi:hypothetical protein
MGNVQSIPPGKRDTAFVTQEELEEFEAYRNGEDNLFEPGIRSGDKGFYDPTAGSKYAKVEKPASTPGPLLATDPGQPKDVGEAKVVGRQDAVDRSEATRQGSSGAVDRSDRSVVSSTSKGRKASTSSTNQE